MPKYGTRKPVDQKQQGKIIKRPVRKYTAEDLEEPEETKGDNLPNILNECDFKVSPAKFGNLAARVDSDSDNGEEEAPLRASLSKLPQMFGTPHD